MELLGCAPRPSPKAPSPSSKDAETETAELVTVQEDTTPPQSALGAVSLESLICHETECSLEQIRELGGDTFVVRDANKEEEAPGPAHWLIHREDNGSFKYQKLFFGYFQKDQPKNGELWSTFSLKQRTDGLLELTGHESSPSGTAWGRDGSLTFSFPQGELLEWTYHWWHASNSSLSGSSDWSWLNLDTDSSTALEIDLPDGFAEKDWMNTDISRCSIPLYQEQGKKKVKLGNTLVAPGDKTLFVRLQKKAINPQSILEICSAGEFEPGPDSEYPGTVFCESFPMNSKGAVTQDGERVNFKIQLPEVTSHVSIILHDASKRTYFVSNDFNFKDAYTLGEILNISPERGRCVLENGVLRPQLQPLNPDKALFDQVM